MTTNISEIRAFTDNYIWAIHNRELCAVVDPGDHEPVIEFLKSHHLSLSHILITHHHYDHTGGVLALKAAFPNVIVYGPNNPKIKGIDKVLKEGDRIELPAFNLQLDILETPGHTLDHIVFYNDKLVFCGDTLFSGGCGRMFEGTPEVFHASLMKLKQLPPETKIYCTHEYTQANLAFALHIEPQNDELRAYASEVAKLREQDKNTLPTNIKKETEINPFLRCHKPSIRDSVSQLANNSLLGNDIKTFAQLRQLKDNY